MESTLAEERVSAATSLEKLYQAPDFNNSFKKEQLNSTDILRKSNRLPRSLLTEEESDQVFAALQTSFADRRTHFDDIGFIKDTGDSVRWMRFEAVIDAADKKEIVSTFVIPDMETRRPMRFTCPGHGDSPCRVSAAANCLLEFPSLLARVIPPTPPNGQSQRSDLMRFRFWTMGRWEEVYLDDMLPFEHEGSQVILETDLRGHMREVLIPRLQYMKLEESQSLTLEMWPFFIEKALAKFLGSFYFLKSVTFEKAISTMMGCEVISRRITDYQTRQVTSLLRILTVLQRNSIVFLRQETPSSMRDCSPECMLHATDDIYVLLAFKEISNVLNLDCGKDSESQLNERNIKVSCFQVLCSVQLLVRRISCSRIKSHVRCRSTLIDRENAADTNATDGYPGSNGSKRLLDMSQDLLFKEKGIFWETAAYFLGHFSHYDMCLFCNDTPETASEDLICLKLLPWHVSRMRGAWVRGKNSMSTGSVSQQSTMFPHYVLDLESTGANKSVLVAITIRQTPVAWRRMSRIPVRLQLYYICEQQLREINRREVYELKEREQLEKRLDFNLQLAHSTAFTTGSVNEFLCLRQGSFLVLLEVGIPGDEADYQLSVYSSSRCKLSPFQNIVDISFESGTCNPMANIQNRELSFCPIQLEI